MPDPPQHSAGIEQREIANHPRPILRYPDSHPKRQRDLLFVQMHFDIVMQWRVVGSTTAPKNFGVQRQEHEVTAAGQCTTRKGGHSESFLFSDPSTGATW